MDFDKDGDIRSKMKRLKPELQNVFLKYMREMCDQESDMMIDFIESSRKQIRVNEDGEIIQVAPRTPQLGTARGQTTLSLTREPSTLHDPDADLTSARAKSARPPVDEVVNKLTVERYMRKKERHARQSEQEELQLDLTPEPQPEEEFHEKRQAHVQSLRLEDVGTLSDDGEYNKGTKVPPLRLGDLGSLTDRGEYHEGACTRVPRIEDPGTLSDDGEYNKETQEIMQDMRAVSARLENERERQAERVRKRRAAKLAKRGLIMNQALELLEKAGESDVVKSKDKERQEQKLRDMLEKKKKERAETPGPRASPRPFLVTPAPAAEEQEAVGAAKVEQPEVHDEESSRRRKKKKNKKDDEKPEEPENEAEEKERKLRRRKKREKKDGEINDSGEEAGQVADEGGAGLGAEAVTARNVVFEEKIDLVDEKQEALGNAEESNNSKDKKKKKKKSKDKDLEKEDDEEGEEKKKKKKKSKDKDKDKEDEEKEEKKKKKKSKEKDKDKEEDDGEEKKKKKKKKKDKDKEKEQEEYVNVAWD